jgi:serine/threonine protein kinase
MAYQLDLREAGEIPASILGYNVRELLGESLLGNTYRVRDAAGRNHALKHVTFRGDDDRSLQHLQNELRVGQAAEHPVLRRPLKLEAGRSMLRSSEAALLMEYFDGPCLEHHRALNELTVLDAFIQIAQGLGALHDKGFVHGDIRPSNLLLNARGQVKIIDFGDACPIGTVQNRVHLDPDYVSQEQLDGKPVTARTDLYAFGACLYWALLRRAVSNLQPTPAKPSKHAIFQGEREVVPPITINPRLPRPLNDFILRCLEIDAEKRPTGMAIAIAILQHARHFMQRGK